MTTQTLLTRSYTERLRLLAVARAAVEYYRSSHDTRWLDVAHTNAQAARNCNHALLAARKDWRKHT
jgi:hypothetical protein